MKIPNKKKIHKKTRIVDLMMTCCCWVNQLKLQHWEFDKVTK